MTSLLVLGRLLHYSPPQVALTEKVMAADPIHAHVSRFTFREEPKEKPTEGFEPQPPLFEENLRGTSKKGASKPFEKPRGAPTHFAGAAKIVETSERDVVGPWKPSFNNVLQYLFSLPTRIKNQGWFFLRRGSRTDAPIESSRIPFVFYGPRKISELLQKDVRFTQILQGHSNPEIPSLKTEQAPKMEGWANPSHRLTRQALVTIADASAHTPPVQKNWVTHLYSFLLAFPSFTPSTPNARLAFLNPNGINIKEFCQHHLQEAAMFAERTEETEALLNETLILAEVLFNNPKECAKFVAVYHEWNKAPATLKEIPSQGMPAHKRRILPAKNEDVFLARSNLIQGGIRVFA